MTEELSAAVQKYFVKGRKIEDRFLELMSRNPMEALLLFLIGGSMIFYNAERHINPKIRTYWDAFYFISTCASVGYADVFAQTQTGKIVSGILNTFGPSLTARLLDRARPETSVNSDEAIVEKLDAILNELRLQSRND
ncbi:ion channel [bacterium]|nr:ion channel [bacterium]